MDRPGRGSRVRVTRRLVVVAARTRRAGAARVLDRNRRASRDVVRSTIPHDAVGKGKSIREGVMFDARCRDATSADGCDSTHTCRCDCDTCRSSPRERRITGMTNGIAAPISCASLQTIAVMEELVALRTSASPGHAEVRSSRPRWSLEHGVDDARSGRSARLQSGRDVIGLIPRGHRRTRDTSRGSRLGHRLQRMSATSLRTRTRSSMGTTERKGDEHRPRDMRVGGHTAACGRARRSVARRNGSRCVVATSNEGACRAVMVTTNRSSGLVCRACVDDVGEGAVASRRGCGRWRRRNAGAKGNAPPV